MVAAAASEEGVGRMEHNQHGVCCHRSGGLEGDSGEAHCQSDL